SPPASGWVAGFAWRGLSSPSASRPEAASQPSSPPAVSTAAATIVVRVRMVSFSDDAVGNGGPGGDSAPQDKYIQNGFDVRVAEFVRIPVWSAPELSRVPLHLETALARGRRLVTQRGAEARAPSSAFPGPLPRASQGQG